MRRALPLISIFAVGCAVGLEAPPDAGVASGRDAKLPPVEGSRKPPPADVLDAAAPATDLAPPPTPPDAAPPPPDAAAPPPPGFCRRHEECGEEELCVAERCTPDPSAPQRVGEGACTNDADEDAFRGGGIDAYALLEECGVRCFGQESSCIQNCVVQAVPLSADCAGCFGDLVACMAVFCAIPCAFEDEADCTDCRRDACDAAFEGCAGLRVPF